MMNKREKTRLYLVPSKKKHSLWPRKTSLFRLGWQRKTAVLVERIIRILVDKEVPLDRILVLTFTKAGAQEFKTELRKHYGKPEHASKAFAVITRILRLSMLML